MLAYLLSSSILSDLFLNQGAPRDRAYQVANVVLQQGLRSNVDPLWIAAIISIENPTLQRHAVSSAGARGIMQVMPGWTTSGFKGCGSDLVQDRTNVCYGVRIWQYYVAENVSHHKALLAYNGCVNAQGCASYAPLVWNRYLLFRHQASFVQNRSWQDNLIWRMSNRAWNREHNMMSGSLQAYLMLDYEAGGERRSARGAPKGARRELHGRSPVVTSGQ
jgi:soluble lytic murein transglycosylase-like protein